jgi:hypothetical protein
MSKENMFLLVFGAVLCCLNLAFGPLAVAIARFFGLLSRDSSPPDARRAEELLPHGPDGAPPAMGETQMSKYR